MGYVNCTFVWGPLLGRRWAQKRAPEAIRVSPAASGALLSHTPYLNLSWPSFVRLSFPNTPLDAAPAQSFPTRSDFLPQAGSKCFKNRFQCPVVCLFQTLKQSRGPADKSTEPLNISPHGPRRPQVLELAKVWRRRWVRSRGSATARLAVLVGCPSPSQASRRWLGILTFLHVGPRRC